MKQQLKESPELLNKISSAVFEAIVIIDNEGKINYWNKAAHKLFGYSKYEVIGQYLHKLIISDNKIEVFKSRFKKFKKSGNAPELGKILDFTAINKNGKTIDIELSLSPIKIKGKWNAIGVIRNTSQRKKAEKELSDSEEKYRLIVENAHDGIEITQDDKIIFANARFAQMLGYQLNEIKNLPFSQVFTKKAKADLYHRQKLRLKNKKVPNNYNTTFKRKDGKIIDVDVKYEIIDFQGKPATFSIIQDITSLKRAQEDLIKNEEKYRDLVEKAGIAIFVDDEKGDFVFFNDYFCSLFGYSRKEMEKQSRENLIHPEDLEMVNEFHKKRLEGDQSPINFQARCIRKNGETFFVEVDITEIKNNNKTIGTRNYLRDITERRNLETQLSHAQKMESIGQLAAGIAHEINTPTQYVNDNVYFFKDSFKDIIELVKKYRKLLDNDNISFNNNGKIDEIKEFEKEIDVEYLMDDIPEAIENSLEGVGRIAKIVKAMKEFSHPGQEEKVKININETLENIITISKTEWKYVADLETNFDGDLPLISCLPSELNQVFLNIIVNAAQSIEEKFGEQNLAKGLIKISTLKNCEYAVIKISDTGMGITKENMSKIFDLFFTTKAFGKGTGQGLAISHVVITQKHNGKIEVESEVGKGSTFIIKIPIDDDKIESREI